MNLRSVLLVTITAALPFVVAAEDLHRERPFAITVVDDATGRGVPLVELQTVNNVRYFTDSHGVVAFDEPALMNQTVFFHVKSHGYEFPKDGFGYRGKALHVPPGGSAELRIKRLNIAERLYRVTGAGVYRDSILVGRDVPIRQPLLNGQVFGSDSVVTTFYHGKLHWFWGDTNRPSYPLGNFNVPGATSLLPADGGLDPAVGVNLDYFVDDKGFAKAMAPLPGEGPTWIFGLVTLTDRAGREHMFASYMKVRGQLDVYERGLAEFDDAKGQFVKAVQFPVDVRAEPGGQPFKHTVNGQEYVYFATPYPLVRVPADPDKLRDLTQYEAYTCLTEGTKSDQHQIDRDEHGNIRYGWKKNTSPVGPKEQATLIARGHLKRSEAILQLQDADTGKALFAHAGSVYWNKFRQRWVMITVEAGGSTSYLGEAWYAEADTPVGPWVYARKIVTHDKYSFYNPKQHPYFDQRDGEVIYFEGTYSHTFSGNNDQTPRYDYNQIMYRLTLSDPRLALPVAVYQLADGEVPDHFGTLAGATTRPIAFFAPDRLGPETVPVYAETDNAGHTRLKVGTPPAGVMTIFHALPADSKTPPKTTVLLYEFIHTDGRRAYSTVAAWSLPGFRRAEQPLCRVWGNPMRVTWQR